MADKILIVVAPYYRHITDMMLAGVQRSLGAMGVDHEVVEVAGAFELPFAVTMAHEVGGYDGYILLGCVIRGETSHYDHICNEVARGVNDLIMRHMAPVGFGLLTVENEQQAIVRADPGQKNKGREAAIACIKMVELAATLRVTG